VYRVTGWEQFKRQSGKVQVTEVAEHATKAGTGLTAEYFAKPNFTESKLKRTDPLLKTKWPKDKDVVPGIAGASEYSVRWTGQFEARLTEELSLLAYVPKASPIKVWLDGKLIIDPAAGVGTTQFDDYANPMNHRGKALVRAGQKYDLKVELVKTGVGDNYVAMHWLSHTMEGDAIPKAYFYPEPLTGKTLHAGGLQAHWPLDETAGTTAADKTGHGHTATVTDGTFAAGGQIQDALEFNGTRTVLKAGVKVSDASYAVSFWFKTAQAGGGLFAVTDDATGHDRDIYLKDGHLNASLQTETITTGGASYADGQWHQVVHVFGGPDRGQRLYVDGHLRAVGVVSASKFTTKTGVKVGHSLAAKSPFFKGRIDDVKLYDGAISAAAIEEGHRRAGVIGHWSMDESAGYMAAGSASGSDAHGHGDVKFVAGKFGNAVAFGPYAYMIADSYLRVPATDFTYSFWFKSTSADANLIVIQRDTTHANPLREGAVALAGGKLTATLAGEAISTPGTFNDGNWHHVAYTAGGDSGPHKLYVDGKPLATGKVTGMRVAFWNIPSERMNVAIGPRGGTAEVTMDDVRVYGRGLSGAEVTALAGGK
jgi:hypothetical protein